MNLYLKILISLGHQAFDDLITVIFLSFEVIFLIQRNIRTTHKLL